MPNLDKTVEIHFNKIKIILVGFGCVVFVIAGVFILFENANDSRRILLLDKLIAIIGILFFGVGIIAMVKVLFDGKPAIIINKDGLFLYSVVNKSQFISWDMIKGLGSDGNNNLLILVKNPTGIIRSHKGLMRKLAELSYRMCGTPYSINSTALKIKYSELEKLLTERLEEFKINKQSNEFINPL